MYCVYIGASPSPHEEVGGRSNPAGQVGRVGKKREYTCINRLYSYHRLLLIIMYVQTLRVSTSLHYCLAVRIKLNCADIKEVPVSIVVNTGTSTVPYVLGEVLGPY